MTPNVSQSTSTVLLFEGRKVQCPLSISMLDFVQAVIIHWLETAHFVKLRDVFFSPFEVVVFHNWKFQVDCGQEYIDVVL